MVNHMEDVFPSPQPYLVKMYRALFVTAYFGLFRVGELTKSQHMVRACDVHIGTNKRKLMFILRSSKTHGEGDKPQVIKIEAIENAENNPKGKKPQSLLPVLDNRRSYYRKEEIC